MELQAVTRFLSGSLLNSLVAGIAIALLAWVIAKVAGRQGSSTRFVVWLFALLAVAVLPWVGPVGAASYRAAPADADRSFDPACLLRSFVLRHMDHRDRPWTLASCIRPLPFAAPPRNLHADRHRRA